MTPELKKQLLIESKAKAFDCISKLALVLDSNRNFHRRVLEVIKIQEALEREINNAPVTTSPQFRCQCADPGCPHCAGECHRDASAQVFRVDMTDESGTPMCDLCAEDALASGLFSFIEEKSDTLSN